MLVFSVNLIIFVFIVKDSDSEWTTMNRLQLAGQKIRNSLEFTGVNEERVYTYTVTFENLSKDFIFTSTSKDATVCTNETIKIAINSLTDLRDLLFNFNKRKYNSNVFAFFKLFCTYFSLF